MNVQVVRKDAPVPREGPVPPLALEAAAPHKEGVMDHEVAEDVDLVRARKARDRRVPARKDPGRRVLARREVAREGARVKIPLRRIRNALRAKNVAAPGAAAAVGIVKTVGIVRKVRGVILRLRVLLRQRMPKNLRKRSGRENCTRQSRNERYLRLIRVV
ncbi:hypothetical protein [Puniceicoccus vermicola]|uniref:Uncharacterized protein n=1 Tax=Puniceicoccus vermicola TaxID=388746 RepID=A0A7X1E7W3_9BACT|nr:hypothetical protein [Puniceicoccus vermicola]MBC2604162.1 hypothetical protein [Puniceicoccus vermicola]